MPITSAGNMPFGKEAEMLSLYRESYDFAWRNWSPWLTEATDDLGFYLGSQWNAQDRAFLKSQKRNALTFNKIRRVVKMVSGYERKTRHSLIAQPVENSDQQTADQLSAMLLWQLNREQMAHTMSDAFEGALKTGINLVELGLSFADDPINGDIQISRVPYNALLLDPRFTRRDLRDCEYVLQRRKLSREAVKALLPFAADEIDGLPITDDDNKYPYMQNYADGRDKGIMQYDQFWLRKFKDVKVLLDQQTGETIEFDSKQINRERLNMFMQLNPAVKVVNKSVPTVELNIFVNDNLMFSGDDPLGLDDFPYVPVMAFWDPEYADQSGYGDFSLKLQSLTRCMKDAQTEVNKRRSKMLDIVDSQVNSGWQVKSNAVVNPKDLYQSGQGKVIWMQDQAQMKDAQRLPAPDIPNGLFNLSQMFDQDVMDIPGATEELLGQVDGNTQISGETVKMRQGAAITIMQDLFDNFNLSKKLLGQKLIKLMQSNYGPEKVQRIINEQPTEEFFTKNFGKFDVTVEESVETPTQRALAYSQLLQARSIGIAVPDSIILDYMPLQDKDKLVAAMQEQEQAQQAQALKDQEFEQMQKELMQAKTFTDIGLGVERIARAEADRGLALERISEVQENNASAVLKRAQAVSELKDLELDRLLRLVEFAKAEQQEQVQQAAQIAQLQTQLSANQVQAGVEFVKSPRQVEQGPATQVF
jgi:hypothetical protein